MPSLAVTRTIDAPPEAVFDTLTVAAGYPSYTPFRRVEMEREGEGRPDGPGAVRALHLVGPPLRERVIAGDRPYRFEFEVLSGAPGISEYRGRQSFERVADATRVTYEIEFEPRVPGTGIAISLALRAAVETLFVLAGRETRQRSA